MRYVDVTAKLTDRLVQRLFRLRLGAVVLPMTMWTLFCIYDPVPWRLWLLGGVLAVTIPLFVISYVRYRSRPITPTALSVNVFVMLVLMVMVVSVTGGVESPFVVGGFPGIVMASFVLLRRRHALLLAAAVSLALGTLFWAERRGLMPHSRIAFYGIGSGFYAAGPYVVVKWCVLTIALFLVATMTSLSGDLHREAGAQLEQARRDLLASYEERIRALEALGAKISHEVRNPLTSIKGLTQLVLREAVGPAREHLGVVSAEVSRLESVLDDYLAFARPTQAARRERVDLAAVLDGLVAAFSPRTEAAGVRVAQQFDTSTAAAGDARRLQQAFFNLVQNALDALDGRGGTLTLSVRPADSGVEAVVADDGPGVPAEVKDRLFVPFATTKPRGTGLGLVIAKGAVEACSGRLTIDSLAGAGTRAVVWLPRWSGEGP